MRLGMVRLYVMIAISGGHQMYRVSSETVAENLLAVVKPRFNA